jgi:acetyl-CoA acetyltransferase
MATYGAKTTAFGFVAVAPRGWAAIDPLAQLGDPISLDDHAASHMISDPLRLLDCCLVSNGAVALIPTRPRARDLPITP